MEPQKKNILLVRHGTTDFNERDLLQGRMDNPLNPRGIEEVNRLAEWIEKESIEIIFTSPLKRALQTAEIINRRLGGVPLVSLDAFCEIDLGDWEGRSYESVKRDFAEFHQRWLLDPALPIPGGESFIGVYERAETGIRHIMDMEQENILICGHATINRGILGNFLKMNPAAARLFRTRNASLSKIIAYANSEGFRAVVDFWNFSPALENLQ